MPKPKDQAGTQQRGPRLNEPVCIGEEVKIGVQLALERFRLDPTQKEISFPSSLTTTERAYVHRVCCDFGSLKTWSRGSGQNRYITVAKVQDSKGSDFKPSVFTLVNCDQHVSKLMQAHPITVSEQEQLLLQKQKNQKGKEFGRDKDGFGCVSRASCQVPPKPGDTDLLQFRRTLPVYKMRAEILAASESNQVILVAGETGSGKTTQVPQLILEKCFDTKQACRILCTQPRRLAAVSVAERVASERSERIGQTVGYQIRLESKVSPKTVLTFCTTGVLLRTLMGGTSCLDQVTHVIVDEVHERDKFTDFLLLCLKEALPLFKNMRVILMSATLNMELFSGYFDNCPVVCVPGNLFPVDEFFLEDVLKWTQYKNKRMRIASSNKFKSKIQEKNLNDWCSKELTISASHAGSNLQDESDFTVSDNTELGEERDDLEPWVVEEVNRLLQDVWLTGNENLFPQILYLISSENVSVDYIHPETGITPLMIAAGRGFVAIVEHLLNLGANVNLKTSNQWTATEFARKFQQNEVADLLEAHASNFQEVEKFDEELELITAEDKELLTVYQQSFDDERVDIDLVTSLIHKLYTSPDQGAILVFLPGYDEIITLKTTITEDQRFEPSRYIIYILHSSLQHSDQKRVFKVPPRGVRKIIFSTNIAETSITINDVVFVVDCGKVKEKTFDALTSLTMLKSNWISKASALQRKGRAGRCQAGKCYHLFSRPRYLHLQDYQTPEILRLPLQELCLHTKLLSPRSDSIANFLSKCPQAPPQLVISNAVQMLMRIDALDRVEDMTELGKHLSDLPIEPRLGKMVLYSVVMKCVDPVLTIVCTLSFKDPFVLPSLPSQKRAVVAKRKKFAEDSYSDHMVLLRAFQAWQKAKMEGWERSFCEKNFISSATMEMLVRMRLQVMGQLKSSGFIRLQRGPGDIRDLNTNSDNWALVKACLVAGSYPSIIQKTGEPALCTEKEPNVRFHNSSVLQQISSITNVRSAHQWKKYVKTLPSKWMIYEEMTRINRVALTKCVSVISPAAVFLFAGPSRLSPDALKESIIGFKGNAESKDCESSREDESQREEDEVAHSVSSPTLQLDEWITFQMENPQIALLAVQLRMKWHGLFLSRMNNPQQPWSQSEEAVLQVIMMVLSSAEKQIGLSNPVSVGQRPQAVGSMDEFHRQSGHGTGMFQQQQHHHHHHLSAFNPHHMTHQQYPRPLSGNTMYHKQQRNNNNPHFEHTNAKSAPRDRIGDTKVSVPQPQSGPSTGVSGNSKSTPTPPGIDPDPDCHFFVMKCTNQRNLDLSQGRSLWATSNFNEAKLNKAFLSGKKVYLVFSVQGSGHFQGYAHMTSLIGKDRVPEFNGPGLSGTFSVQWEKRANVPFQMTQLLVNPWNENRKIQISRDGQEIEPKVGATLLKLWDPASASLHKGKPRPNSGWHRAQGKQAGRQHKGHNSQPQQNAKGGKQLQQASAAHTKDSKSPSSSSSSH